MHSHALRKLILLLQRSRRDLRLAQGKPAPISKATFKKTRRDFVKSTATAGVAAGLLSTSLPKAFASAHKAPRIAIIGAGVAGLNAAYQLRKAGLKADVYEASHRLGGRIHSLQNALGMDLTVELGGELINTDHADMLGLVDDFGLQLFSRIDDADAGVVENTAYYFAGKSWSEEELATLLASMVEQIANDNALLDSDWDTYAPDLDSLSAKDYLDRHSDLISRPFIRTIFEDTIRTEYGVEPQESSALQLLSLLPTVDGQEVDLLSYSDEVYTVIGGNSRIIRGLELSLQDNIHKGYQLEHITKPKDASYALHFKNNRVVEADYVVFAMPNRALREIELRVDVPRAFRRLIKVANLGRNEKLIAGYNTRAWRTEGGFDLEAWTDLGFSEVWDAAQREADKPQGALTYFLGGADVDNLAHSKVSAADTAKKFTHGLNKFIPGFAAAFAHRQVKTDWKNNPFIGGGYINYQPGVLTKFSEFFWVESDDPDEVQSLVFGNLVFAGEQFSDAFYGFMNGGAQTGRLAAAAIVDRIAK